MIQLRRVFDVKVLQVDFLKVGKGVKNALEKRGVLIAMHPVLIHPGLYLFELEAGEGVESEVEPVFSVYHKIADEETLCCARQIKHTNNVVDF